jgi:hypothetical protein
MVAKTTENLVDGQPGGRRRGYSAVIDGLVRGSGRMVPPYGRPRMANIQHRCCEAEAAVTRQARTRG